MVHNVDILRLGTIFSSLSHRHEPLQDALGAEGSQAPAAGGEQEGQGYGRSAGIGEGVPEAGGCAAHAVKGIIGDDQQRQGDDHKAAQHHQRLKHVGLRDGQKPADKRIGRHREHRQQHPGRRVKAESSFQQLGAGDQTGTDVKGDENRVMSAETVRIIPVRSSKRFSKNSGKVRASSVAMV